MLMARAAAPMFRGLRVATSTTRRWSMRDGEFMSGYSKSSGVYQGCITGHDAIDRRGCEGIGGDGRHFGARRGLQMNLQFLAQAINKAADGA